MFIYITTLISIHLFEIPFAKYKKKVMLKELHKFRTNKTITAYISYLIKKFWIEFKSEEKSYPVDFSIFYFGHKIAFYIPSS